MNLKISISAIILLLLGYIFVIGSACSRDKQPSTAVKTPDSLSASSQLDNQLNTMQLQKDLPAYRLNELKGDISFGQGKYFEAQKYYRRVINAKEMRNNLNAVMRLEFMLMLTFDAMGDYSLMAKTIDSYDRSARRVGDDTYLASVPFFKGKITYYQGQTEEGYELLHQAINMMKKSHGKEKDDFLMYFYNSSLKILQKDRLPNRAIAMLREMDKIFNQSHRQTNSPAFPYKKYLKEYYGCRAITLQRIGHTDEASEYYNKFLSMTEVYIYDLKCIESYIVEKQLYDDIIYFGNQRLDYMTHAGDTLNSNTAPLYRLMAKAHMAKGNYKEALECYSLMDKTNKEIGRLGELSAIEEISSNYVAHIAELERQQRSHNMKVTNILVVVGIILIMAALTVFWSMHYNRIIRRKNLSMVKKIDELITIRDQQKASLELFQSGSPTTTARNESLHRRSMESVADFQERKKFARMNSDIINKKLYCDPELCRATLLEMYNIPRNSFSSMFQKYTGTSYSKYINNLRLEAVTRMLKEQPNYTIEAIAADCGINSVATLYRLFSKHYGMTPMEYRQALMLSERTPNDPTDDEELA